MSGFFYFVMFYAVIAACVFAARKSRKRAVAAIAVAFVTAVIGGNLNDHAATASTNTAASAAATEAPEIAAVATDPPATDPPTPKPDMHAARVTIHDWWEKVTSNLAMAQVALDQAKDAVGSGDMTSASQDLSLGQKFAGNAKEAAAAQPDGRDDIGTGLFGASIDFNDALGHMRDYLDSSKPSDAASALDSSSSARDQLEQATHEARVKYESMGGKWSDLEDVPTQATSLNSAFKALEQ